MEGLWEKTNGTVRRNYAFGGQLVAVRAGATTSYIHGGHLGSVSATTSTSGALASMQHFDPWGKVIATGGSSPTRQSYTGQYLDDTGLLFYNARYYDPGIGRFISADSVVPGSASGDMAGIALKPLTVSFNEPSFVSSLTQENQFGPWFMLSDKERRQLGSIWGPANPQSLNRYSYVLNNPMRYTDPSGHYVEPQIVWLYALGWGYSTVIGSDPNASYTDGLGNPLIRDPDTGVLYRMHNGQRDRLMKVIDCSTRPCVMKYVYESDPDFQDYRRHADAAKAAWSNKDTSALAGAIGGCATVIIGGPTCLAGGIVGGASVGIGFTAWAIKVEWDELQAARLVLSEMKDVGKPKTRP